MVGLGDFSGLSSFNDFVILGLCTSPLVSIASTRRLKSWPEVGCDHVSYLKLP